MTLRTREDYHSETGPSGWGKESPLNGWGMVYFQAADPHYARSGTAKGTPSIASRGDWMWRDEPWL